MLQFGGVGVELDGLGVMVQEDEVLVDQQQVGDIQGGQTRVARQQGGHQGE